MLVADNLEWKNVYFIQGAAPKHARLRNAVKDPSNSGWTLCFVLVGEKRSTLFNPWSFESWTVPNDCLEVSAAEEPRDEFRVAHMEELMREKWAKLQGAGFMRDYDTCALVMRRLGWAVPAQVLTGGGEDTRKKGGKDVATRLLKPVKRASKRGKVLAWLLENDGSRSVREAMVEFSVTRSNALSHLYMLQKDHGIGYELVGDVATVTLPDGCMDPFDEPAEPAEPASPSYAVDDDDDDSWLD